MTWNNESEGCKNHTKACSYCLLEFFLTDYQYVLFYSLRPRGIEYSTEFSLECLISYGFMSPHSPTMLQAILIFHILAHLGPRSFGNTLFKTGASLPADAILCLLSPDLTKPGTL